MADNDLAFGRIVEGLSHSPFWKEMAIFAIEDDPQDGWDHVSGYRTTAYVVSPYAKRGAVVSTQYNTTSLLRTIEQILGLPPMNQFDASADADVRLLHRHAGLHALRRRAEQRPARPDEPRPAGDRRPASPRRDALASARMNFRAGGPGPGGRAEPHPLARHAGLAGAVPGVGRHRGRRRRR